MLTRRSLLQSALLLPLNAGLLDRTAAAAQTEPDVPPRSLRREAGLDRYIKEWRERENIPAVYLALVHGNSQFYGSVSGVLKRGAAAPAATLENRFRIGSVTKPMTSTLVLLLANERVLDLNAHPSLYLPQMRKNMNSGYSSITLRHLLAHTAGLPGPGTGRGVPRKSGESIEQHAMRERITVASEDYFKDPPTQPVGQYSYSNNGYMVLGAIAEAATGIPYESLMVERLFRPLRMMRSGVGLPGTKGTLSEPWYHPVKDGQEGVAFEPIAENDQGTAALPQGGVYTTVLDSCQFMQAHLRWYESRIAGGSVLGMQRTTREAMFAEPFSMGRNLVWRTWQEGRFGIALTHTGGNADFRGQWQCCNMRIIPGAKTGIFLVTNNGIDGEKVHQMVNQIQEYVLGKV